MIRYINTKFKKETETVDELNSNDFNTFKEFRKELRRLTSEYSMAYNQYCYISCRSTRAWRVR